MINGDQKLWIFGYMDNWTAKVPKKVKISRI